MASRNRSRLTVGGAVLAAVLAFAGPAAATTGLPRLQRLAVAQTELLFRDYTGQPQIVSPKECNSRAAGQTYRGVLLLPALSFGSGNATVRCRTDVPTALLDLGGFVPTEDARDDTYTLADGTVLRFSRDSLQAICDDVVQYVPQVPATLDGQPISGSAVITRNFDHQVDPGADNTPGNPFYQDSIDLGHPGRLTSCYSGRKTLLHLTPGRHVVRVDLRDVAGAATHLVYLIRVADD